MSARVSHDLADLESADQLGLIIKGHDDDDDDDENNNDGNFDGLTNYWGELLVTVADWSYNFVTENQSESGEDKVMLHSDLFYSCLTLNVEEVSKCLHCLSIIQRRFPFSITAPYSRHFWSPVLVSCSFFILQRTHS